MIKPHLTGLEFHRTQFPVSGLHHVSRSLDASLSQRALVAWGAHAQIDVAQEEFAELIVELSHAKRGRENNIVEELADAILMLEQILQGVSPFEVAEAIVAKQTRLATLLDRADAARAQAEPCPECGCER